MHVRLEFQAVFAAPAGLDLAPIITDVAGATGALAPILAEVTGAVAPITAGATGAVAPNGDLIETLNGILGAVNVNSLLGRVISLIKPLINSVERLAGTNGGTLQQIVSMLGRSVGYVINELQSAVALVNANNATIPYAIDAIGSAIQALLTAVARMVTNGGNLTKALNAVTGAVIKLASAVSTFAKKDVPIGSQTALVVVMSASFYLVLQVVVKLAHVLVGVVTAEVFFMNLFTSRLTGTLEMLIATLETVLSDLLSGTSPDGDILSGLQQTLNGLLSSV